MAPATIKSRRTARRNTTTWVDDRYGQLLARQTVDRVMPADESAGGELLTLGAVRRSHLYICERPGKVGFGMKRGTRVWHLDGSSGLSGVGIYTVDYDRSGRVIIRSMYSPPVYVITRHALARLFQRMRTNSLDEVTRFALAPIAYLDPPYKPGLAAEIVVVGRGTFHAVSEIASTSVGVTRVAWVLKTFIDKE
jgi:hypothetical protein